VKGGTEAVKLLLAKERLDDKALKQNYRFWEEGAAVAAVDLESEITSQEKSASPMAKKTTPLGMQTVTAGAEDFKDAKAGYTETAEYGEWTNFPLTGAVYGYFGSFLKSVEDNAADSAKIIAKMKKKVGITDKWVKGVERDYTYMLQVKDNAEYLYRRDGDSFKQTRRYTREDAKNVYETYSYYEYENGTTGNIRNLYIPGERYEDMYENSNGFKDYVIVENSRGYWTFMRMGTVDGREYSFDTYVIKDGIGYNAFIQIQGDDGVPTAAWYNVFDPVEGREYFRFSPYWKTAYYTVYLETFKDGLLGVRAYGDEAKAEMYTGRGGHEFEHGYPLTLVTENGEIAPETKVGNVTYDETYIQFDSMDVRYEGGVEFSVDTVTEYAPVGESLAFLNEFYKAYGLETYYDFDEVVKGVELARLLTEEFGNTYFWNGYALNSVANANKARGVLLDYYDEVNAEFAEVKNNETVRARQRLDGDVHFAPVANLEVGETAYAGGKVNVSGLSFAVKDATLLEKGSGYTAQLGLSLLNENGKPCSVNTVALSGGNSPVVLYESGELHLSIGGEYILPKNLCEGKYALVVYATTEDGLRVSELKPITLYSIEEGALESEAMAVTVESEEDKMFVNYAVQLSVWVEAEEGRAYTGAEMERLLLRVALAKGYPKEDERVTTETGEAVDLSQTLAAGVYRLKIYVATADGISEAYAYCKIEEYLRT
ncbi:MAG: hypothetical protein IJB97_07415, partial [Clostridia bacterium]|nr:hypothetical protein [Clostridia bacterium]